MQIVPREKIKCMTDTMNCEWEIKDTGEKKHKELRKKIKVKEEIKGAVSIKEKKSM